ncbi:hypothetical protein QZH41_003150 [Actinostola sp. cb2023]|nr:hypothetical protein QZH41_003150 [Actinostola sp. cb2023]
MVELKGNNPFDIEKQHGVTPQKGIRQRNQHTYKTDKAYVNIAGLGSTQLLKRIKDSGFKRDAQIQEMVELKGNNPFDIEKQHGVTPQKGIRQRNQHTYKTDKSGFRRHHGTDTALIKTVDKILLDLDKDCVNGLVLIDYRKAFDMVDHNILMAKLKVYGMEGSPCIFTLAEKKEELMGSIPNYPEDKLVPAIMYEPDVINGYNGDNLIIGVIANFHNELGVMYSWYYMVKKSFRSEPVKVGLEDVGSEPKENKTQATAKETTQSSSGPGVPKLPIGPENERQRQPNLEEGKRRQPMGTPYVSYMGILPFRGQ